MRLLMFVALLGAAAVTMVSCEMHRHQLLGNGYVNVTMESRTCLNNKPLSVPVLLVGEASVAGAPRRNFSSDKRFLAMDGIKNPTDKIDADERGHLVASTIGGPPDDTWNMVPQRTSVNRKISKESNLMGRWDEFEAWMVEEIKGKATVYFTIEVNYERASGCRPVSFKADGRSNAKPSTGYRAIFDNRPGGPFGAVAQTQKQMKDKKP
ncbi:unnamed protein product [Macrosiphum euphorbiae]|uniref:Type VII secretion system protein EssD-like domain-containing protein n=1 Tax=Macrosiphum euphorbiae TaxID=13131 RepID=A0AAV0W5R2_9HEMI|nr:unnamed protein product [Macrosiphum euphorbiae]